jgi:eukaryotic-like serine/threonine-protein kinase
MDKHQFAEVKELFALVCDLPAAQRRQQLATRTNDAEVVEEVLALIEQGALRTTRFSQPVVGALAAIAHAPLHSGDVLGAWTLADEIGHGGMGKVFRAARSDGNFEQTAAIKLLGGIANKRALEYLARERQILASLSHPNIARLFDGGTTSDGQPYLVMEHVEGLPIDQYCRQHKLSRAEILKLFMLVCAAVAFAHQRLVVHCDLKPSNILVTNEGRPILLDFGVSRLLNAASVVETDAPADAVNDQTLTGAAFTPRYASPEQKARGEIGTGSDVYSLGLMLCELMGVTLPSTAPMSMNSLATLPSDLTAIIIRATAWLPTHRYFSVTALADDLQRFLDHRPVAAQPHTTIYTAGKLLRRQWPWMLAASVVALTLGGSAWRVLLERDVAIQANGSAQRERAAAVSARDTAEAAREEASRERDRAKLAQVAATEAGALAEAGRVRATSAEARALSARDAATSAVASSKRVNQFLVSIFSGVNPASGGNREALARDIVAQAEKKLDDLKDISARDRADLFMALDGVHTSLGANADAERYRVRTVAALAELGNSAVAERALILGHLSRTRVRRGEGDALSPANEALAITQAKFGASSIYVGRALLVQASALAVLQRTDEEQSSRARAKAIFENLPITLETVIDVNIFWGDHGHVEFARGNYSAAEAAYRRALDGMARFPSAYKDDKFNVFVIQRSLAMTLNALSRYTEAETLLTNAYTECVARNGAVSQQCLSIDANYASVLVGQRKLTDAIPVQMRRVTHTAALEGTASLLYATALSEYGQTLIRAGGADNLTKAEPMLREAFATAKKLEVTTSVRRNNMGIILLEYLRAQKRFDEALMLANELLDIVKQSAPADNDRVIRATIRVAQHEQLLGQHAAADARLNAVLPLMPKMTPFAKFDFYQVKLRSLQASNSEPSEILAAHREALAAATLAYGVNNVTVKRINAEIEKLGSASAPK